MVQKRRRKVMLEKESEPEKLRERDRLVLEAEPETNQHFVVVKLKYRFFDGEE